MWWWEDLSGSLCANKHRVPVRHVLLVTHSSSRHTLPSVSGYQCQKNESPDVITNPASVSSQTAAPPPGCVWGGLSPWHKGEHELEPVSKQKAVMHLPCLWSSKVSWNWIIFLGKVFWHKEFKKSTICNNTTQWLKSLWHSRFSQVWPHFILGAN